VEIKKEGKFFGANFVKDKHGNANSACVFDLVILILISKNTVSRAGFFFNDHLMVIY